MFGFLKCVESELSPEDFSNYRSFYCGLCRRLGQTFGAPMRMTLTFEGTFLALVYASLDYAFDTPTERSACTTYPFRKVNFSLDERALTFASDMSALLVYFKLLDDIEDHKGLRKALTKTALEKLPTLTKIHPLLSEKYPKLLASTALLMQKQTALELTGCTSLDEICIPSAESLSEIFLEIPHKDRDSFHLSRFAFFLGRWVYLMDAAKDYFEDRRSGDYNIFLLRHPDILDKKSLSQAITATLSRTLSAASYHYSHLPLKRFRSILDNIVYLGLPTVQTEVFLTNKELRARQKKSSEKGNNPHYEKSI